jgi:hypothetical protein
MSSKKSKSKSKPMKPKLIEILALFIVLLVIIFISIVTIFNYPTFPIRMNFTAVKSITIQDNWTGYSNLSPIQVNYQLTFQNGALIGTGNFSIASQQNNYQAQAIPIEIPIPVTQAFFQKLKEIQLIEGHYSPNIQKTDDYPSLSITLDTRRETIEIFSQSQGKEHIPWSAYMRDKEYIIESGIPAEALAIIEPYLSKDVLENLIVDFMGDS